MNIGNTIFIFFNKPNLPTTGEKTLSASKVASIIGAATGTLPSKILVRDESKVTWDLSVWREFLELGYVKNRVYVAEKFDCDKYSLVMSATAAEVLGNSTFGIMDHDRTKFGDAHSMNFFVDSSGKVWVYEPQTGETLPYGIYSSAVGCKPRLFLL